MKSKEIEIAGQRLAIRFPESLEGVVDDALSGGDYPPVLPAEHPVCLIVDIGANIGASALMYAHRYPEARILCFEPARETFELLCHNTASLRQIECYPWAISDATGTGRLYHGAEQWAQNSLWQSGMTTEQHENVTVYRASEALGKLGVSDISILKIDAEGSEVAALRDLLGSGQFSIDAIQLEYHSERDRRRIDGLLVDSWLLVFSDSTKIHRGRASYIRADLCPESVYYEIHSSI